MGLLVKRLFDVAVSACALIALLPVLLIIGLLVRLSSPGPVFFAQERIGPGGRPFRLIKFRSMTVGSDRGSTRLTEADPRITAIGRLLRRYSLDELPQLFNVLRGDMSLVGPRPLLPRHALQLDALSAVRRHRMRPGLTGWAQINGRNGLTRTEQLALDLWYVDHWTLGLDLHIVIRTLVVVATGQGLYAAGDRRMR